MVLSSDELEKIQDDLQADRIIGSSIHCGRCGYNLRTLPYKHTCPECGNPYNARPLKMKGIFIPHSAYLPLSDILSALFFCFIATVLISGGLENGQFGTAASGVASLGLAVLLAVQAYRRLSRFLKSRAVSKRIALEEVEPD